MGAIHSCRAAPPSQTQATGWVEGMKGRVGCVRVCWGGEQQLWQHLFGNDFYSRPFILKKRWFCEVSFCCHHRNVCVCLCMCCHPSSITPPSWCTSCPSPLCTGKHSYHLNSVLMGWEKEKCGGFSPDGTTRCTPPLFFSIPKSLPSLSCLLSLLDFEPSWRRCFFLESAPESLAAALIISQLQLYTSNIHTFSVWWILSFSPQRNFTMNVSPWD